MTRDLHPMRTRHRLHPAAHRRSRIFLNSCRERKPRTWACKRVMIRARRSSRISSSSPSSPALKKTWRRKEAGEEETGGRVRRGEGLVDGWTG